MQKFSMFGLMFLLFYGFVFAEETITASKIIDQINNGKNVVIKNATVKGVLDFTELANQRLASRFFSDNDTYKSEVEVSLYFENCTFDDVLAFKYDERKEIGYIADFMQPVKFINCSFKGLSEFKHSDFDDEADFSGSTFAARANFKHATIYEQAKFENSEFHDDANFKHTTFKNITEFKSAKFLDDANFKHTNFKRAADFSHSHFKKSVNFKHTAFKQVAHMNNVVIDGDVNFKHTHFKSLDMDGLQLNGDINTKHATVGGRAFSRYLMNRK